MKLMLGQLTIIIQGISAIVNEKIPINTSYWLTRNADKLTSEIKIMEKSRQKLLEIYTEKDKDGKMVLNEDKMSFKIKNMEVFQKEFGKLASTEVDVNLKTFKRSDFGKADISMNDLIKLKPIISDWENDEPKGKSKKGNIVKFKKKE